MNKVIAVVGMPGSGKTEVSRYLTKKGFAFIRMGQVVLDEVIKKGLEPGEATERPVREGFREKRGMAAIAILNFPKIDTLSKRGNVVLDGMYSWEEYKAIRKKYGKRFFVIAVYASPKSRYKRLSKQKFDKGKDKNMTRRNYTEKEAKSRDFSEIEKLNKGGPIAMADFTITNDGSKNDLIKSVERIMRSIK